MAKHPETPITESIIARIKQLGGRGWHVHGSMLQPSGEPDIDGCLPNNIHLKVEVKTPTGTPSEKQLYRLRFYARYGYLVGIVTSVEEFDKLLAGTLEDTYGLHTD